MLQRVSHRSTPAPVILKVASVGDLRHVGHAGVKQIVLAAGATILPDDFR
jgi:hypothetical protein